MIRHSSGTWVASPERPPLPGTSLSLRFLVFRGLGLENYNVLKLLKRLRYDIERIRISDLRVTVSNCISD